MKRVHVYKNDGNRIIGEEVHNIVQVTIYKEYTELFTNNNVITVYHSEIEEIIVMQ